MSGSYREGERSRRIGKEIVKGAEVTVRPAINYIVIVKIVYFSHDGRISTDTDGGFGGGDSNCRCRVNRQVESDDRVAAVGTRKCSRVVAGSGEDFPIPLITFACRYRKICGVCMRDRKVKRHHTVTAHCVGQREIVVARLRVCGAIPVETIADNDSSISVRSFVNSQMKGYHRITTCCICEGVCQVLARLCDACVFIPIKAVAGNGSGVSIRSIVDSQMKSYH